MPNSFGPSGLEVATKTELIARFTIDMQDIYGPDIDLSSNTPDGQMMNIFLQAVVDLSDILVQIYNTFDPDNAIGAVLDQRVAINGIQRKAGTFTVTDVTIVNNQSVNLYGLDQDVQPVFTVADNAGNNWQLQVSQLGLAAGTNVFSFQAAEPGATLTVPNTITVPVTIVLGVVSINNPTVYTTLGINEESDAALKVRRQQSVSLASQGYLSGLLAALQNINGVTSAFVYENTTSITDGDGVPGHSIWVIVAGTATSADIAQAIYTKRNAGCGMFGQTSYAVTQADSSSFLVYWDTVASQNLYMAFTVTSLDGVNPPNIAAIREGLVLSFEPGVNEEVNINRLATDVQVIDGNTLVTNAGFSVAQTQTLTLSGVAASGAFKINYNGNQSASINWNDAIGVIQGKVQAVTGLTAALVTGSIASQSLVFNLSAVNSVLGLVYVSNNTLATVAPAAITFSYNEGYANILEPTVKTNQFSIASADIVILPMQLSPYNSITAIPIQVAATETEQFTGLGGYGTLVYSFTTNNSGGTIDASTGLYTAGPTPSTDTIKATDKFGNIASAVVTVV